MTDPERLQHALDLAYRFLGHRDRTVAEVRERLGAEGVEEAVIDEAVGLSADGSPAVADAPIGPIEGEVVEGAEAPEANGQPAAAA